MYTCGQTPNSGTFTWQTPPLRLFNFGSSPILYRSPIYDKFCGVSVIPTTKVCDNVSGFQNIFVNLATNQVPNGYASTAANLTVFNNIQLSKIYEDTTQEIFQSEIITYNLPSSGYLSVTHANSGVLNSIISGGVCDGVNISSTTKESDIFNLYNPRNYDFKLTAIHCSGDPTTPGVKNYRLYINENNYHLIDGTVLDATVLIYLGNIQLSCGVSSLNVTDQTYRAFSFTPGFSLTNYINKKCYTLVGTSGVYVM